MRALTATGFCLALGVFVGGALAEDIAWQPAASRPVQATGDRIGAPASAWEAAPPASQPWASAQAVTLSRPVPLTAPGTQATSGITPVAFGPVPLVRAKAADELRMPTGAPPITEIIQSSPGQTEDIPINPTPVPSTRIFSGMAPMPGSQIFGGDIIYENSDCGCGLGMDSGCCCDSGPCCCDTGAGCCNNGCCDNSCCYPRGHFWLSAEYLLWGTKGPNAPALLTVTPPGTPIGPLGYPQLPSSTTVFDQNALAGNLRSGARFTGGFWLPCLDQGWGLEASYMFLGQVNKYSSINSNSNPTEILTRPYTEINSGAALAFPTAIPGVFPGSFAVSSSSYLWGMEANVRRKLCCGPCSWLDLLVGYRHMQLQDSINIYDVEDTTVTQDGYSTRNIFNGGQVGLDGEWHFWRRWFVGGTVKVALGDMQQTVQTFGSNNFPSGLLLPGVFPGYGFLAQSNTNVSQNRFAVVPEFALKVGVNLTSSLRLFVGYDFLYMSSVVRAGDQINTTINLNRLAGGTGTGPTPQVFFKTTDFWAQGMNVGLEWRH